MTVPVTCLGDVLFVVYAAFGSTVTVHTGLPVPLFVADVEIWKQFVVGTVHVDEVVPPGPSVKLNIWEVPPCVNVMPLAPAGADTVIVPATVPVNPPLADALT